MVLKRLSSVVRFSFLCHSQMAPQYTSGYLTYSYIIGSYQRSFFNFFGYAFRICLGATICLRIFFLQFDQHHAEATLHASWRDQLDIVVDTNKTNWFLEKKDTLGNTKWLGLRVFSAFGVLYSPVVILTAIGADFPFGIAIAITCVIIAIACVWSWRRLPVTRDAIGLRRVCVVLLCFDERKRFCETGLVTRNAAVLTLFFLVLK